MRESISTLVSTKLRRRAGGNDALDRFAPDANDVVRRRIGNRPLDDVAHEGKRDADRRDDLGVPREAMVKTADGRCERDERRSAAAAADQLDVLAVEFVIVD